MTAPRQYPAKSPIPAASALPERRAAHETPQVSGEYRLSSVPTPKTPSRNAIGAVRPRIRAASTPKMAKVTAASESSQMPVHRDMTRDMTGEPRRYPTVQMRAFEPPRASGADLSDFGFDFDIDADGALDLDCLPSSQNTRGELRWQSTPEAPSAGMGSGPRLEGATDARRDSAATPALVLRRTASTQMPRVTASGAMRRTSSGQMLPPAPSVPVTVPGRRSSKSIAAVDPHAALVAFAGFGDAPDGLWASQAYALRVIVRRRSLRKDLAAARARRSPDVGLYEASLRTADDAVVKKGLIMMVMLALSFSGLLGGLAFVLAVTLRATG